MIKKISKITLKVIILVGLIVGVAILLRDSSDRLKTLLYDAAAPTPEKFSKMKRWLPSDAELIVVTDIHLFFAEPGSRARTSRRLEDIGKIWNVDPDLLSMLMAQAEGVGLVAAALSLNPNTGAAEGLLVVQGNYKEAEFVQSVESTLVEQGDKLIRDEQQATIIYTEAPSDGAFAFALPDRNHLVIGPKEAIVKLIQREGAGEIKEGVEAQWSSAVTDKPIFGRLLITPRVGALLPDTLKEINLARFSSDADLNFELNFPCFSIDQAKDLAMFIEGSRVSFLLAHGKNTKLVGLLRDVQVSVAGANVKVFVPLGKVF